MEEPCLKRGWGRPTTTTQRSLARLLLSPVQQECPSGRPARTGRLRDSLPTATASLGWQGRELLQGTGAWQPPEGALLELYWVPGHIAVPCDGYTFQETRMPHILFLSLWTGWMSHVSQEPADLPAAGIWTAPAAASEHRSRGGWLAKAG